MNIFQAYAQPARSVMDYQADYDNQDLRREQLGATRRTNELADLTATQTRQTMAEASSDRNILRQLATQHGGDEQGFIRALGASGSPGLMKLAGERDKAALDRGKTTADTAKTAAETKALHAKDKYEAADRLAQKIGMVNTPDDVQAYEDEGIALGIFPAERRGYSLQQAQKLGGIEQWKAASSKASVPVLEQFKTASEMARAQLVADTSITTTGMTNQTSLATNEATNATSLATNAETVRAALAGQRSVAATAAAGRGVQLQVAGMVDARARDKNANDKAAVGKVEWKQDTDGNWMALPKEVKTGDVVTPIATTAPGKRSVQAGHALDIIAEARTLIDKGTGSYAGAAIDQAARVVGTSTKGGEVAAKLKALEGALMMAQPRMEGPQSNMDVLLYKQMAGQIGDSTLPAGNKKAAIDTIEKLHTKYKNGVAPSSPGSPPADAAPAKVTDDASYNALPAGATFIGPDGKTRRKP